MADPLSIAGSVVGITAAGVQASVKLYALAEKVATASQRVTSIADDISSTCAILNQVRELIIPQPDVQGTLKSVFNTVALNDISQALRRCRSSFTDIEALLRRAFEQVGKRPALRSNIKLSRFEQAKWPFLQPQFDELRNDLRDAKGNLVLMIAVASLALAQRDGRQRPIHETEKLEFTSTIVQLQRARPIPSPHRDTSQSSRDGLQGQSMEAIRNLGIEVDSIKESGPSRSISRRSVPQHESEDSTNPTRLISKPVALSVLAPGIPPSQSTSTFADTSGQSVDDNAPKEQRAAGQSSPRTETSVNAKFIPPSKRQNENLARNVSTSEPNIASESIALMPSTTSHGYTLPPPPPHEPAMSHQPAPPPPPAPIHWSKPSCYAGWTTSHLHGLTTGYGNAISLDRMNLPDQSFERIIKAYTDEGQDVHITMSELTREQQALIQRTCPNNQGVEVVYVRLQRNITVSSVFGMLNVETLKWIITSDTPFVSNSGATPPIDVALPNPQHYGGVQRSGYSQSQHSSFQEPTIPNPYFRGRDRQREERPKVLPDADDESSDSESWFDETSPPPARRDESKTSSNARTIEFVAEEFLPSNRSEDGMSQHEKMPEYTLYSNPRENSASASFLVPVHRCEHQEASSQPAEENEEDIVNELLARWTTS